MHQISSDLVVRNTRYRNLNWRIKKGPSSKLQIEHARLARVERQAYSAILLISPNRCHGLPTVPISIRYITKLVFFMSESIAVRFLCTPSTQLAGVTGWIERSLTPLAKF